MDVRSRDNLHAAHFQTVEGVIAHMPLRDMAANYGLLLADLKLLTEHRLWTNAADRRRIKMTLEGVMMGALDLLAFPRIELPAEFIASWIVALVSPMNVMAACAMFDRPRRAADIASQEGPEDSAYETVSPARLFALCHQIASRDPATVEAVRGAVHAALLTSKEIVTDSEEVGDHARQ